MNPSNFSTVRLRLSWTQERMAHALGVSSSEVCRYEQGSLPIPADVAQTVQRIAGHARKRCGRCGGPIVVEFWDHCCGACTQPLSEDA